MSDDVEDEATALLDAFYDLGEVSRPVREVNGDICETGGVDAVSIYDALIEHLEGKREAATWRGDE